MVSRVVGDRYPTFLPTFVHGHRVGMHQISSISQGVIYDTLQAKIVLQNR